MKVINRLCAVFLLLQAACADSELKISEKPFIRLESIEFIKSDGVRQDEILIRFYYRDGDNDLGLTNLETAPPDQSVFLYVEDASGDLDTIPANFSYITYSNSTVSLLDINTAELNADQRIVTASTRLRSAYGYLPLYTDTDKCFFTGNYMIQNYLIASDKTSVTDDSYNLIDTFIHNNEEHYIVQDTLYFDLNQDWYNMHLKFYLSEDELNWDEFSWENEFCATFNGRFADISGLKLLELVESNPFTFMPLSSKSGYMSYSMKTNAFSALFGTKLLKIELYVTDRALHHSNTIEGILKIN